MTTRAFCAPIKSNQDYFCDHDVPFGASMRAQCFVMEPSLVNFNHGSFGACPRQVIQARRSYEDTQEQSPDAWMRGGYEMVLDVVRANLAAYVNAPVSNIVFIENASSGVSLVFFFVVVFCEFMNLLL
jgi:selenocysteine lyase/cysteine desulfurase